ncbi:preprotein translocase [Rodentibacter ratti]|uniref:Preprotein translocase n=1 Tax=Rodentibacter ratti TaxID=1906745 RepID=A0A1V3KV41_9PAST|nr:integrase arm-type DNA-binding domain-containing protein [Rodentibacter ratti]OOF81190.1 preprotein translocase [Rodentibacter ratti]
MARLKAGLTNTQAEKAKPKLNSKGQLVTNELADGKGLWLFVFPANNKAWYFRYDKPITKKRTKFKMGDYPTISIAQARSMREEYRSLLAQGIDPQEAKAQAQTQAEQEQHRQRENTFYRWAEKWKENKQKKVLPETMQKNWRRMEKYLFDELGNYQVNQIDPPTLIKALEPLARIKDRKTGTKDSDTLRRVLRLTNEVLTFAKNSGAIPYNPCLAVKDTYHFSSESHHPHIMPEELPALMNDLAQARALPITKYLMLFQLLTMTRPGEASGAKWQEIDLAANIWTIPPERMKMRAAHKIPLSSQALAILHYLQPITGRSEFVFQSTIKAQQSTDMQSINKALIDMGYKGKQVAHSLRSIGSTYLNSLLINSDVIERCLSHTERNSVRAAYNHTDYFEQRIPVMQQWGDYVEQCAQGTDLFK